MDKNEKEWERKWQRVKQSKILKIYSVNVLKAFTKYMDDNGLNKNEPFRLFMNNPCTNMVANSIEELYTNFKIFVNGYLTLQ